MTPVVRLIMAITAFAAIPAWSAEPGDLGPRPDWTRYRALGEAAVRAQLADPQNWSFEWPNGYADIGTRPTSPWHGWTTCALMRAATPVRDRSPVTQFIVVVDHDQVRNIKISARQGNTMVNMACGQAVRSGRLPPASLMSTVVATGMETAAPVSIASIGIDVRPTADGAYVDTVASGSPAASAGLLPGMVITGVNGIALAGMGTAMTRILASDQGRFDIQVATGQRMVLTPSRPAAATP